MANAGPVNVQLIPKHEQCCGKCMLQCEGAADGTCQSESCIWTDVECEQATVPIRSHRINSPGNDPRRHPVYAEQLSCL